MLLNLLANFSALSIILVLLYSIVIIVRFSMPSERAWGTITFKGHSVAPEDIRLELHAAGKPEAVISESMVGPRGQFFLTADKRGTYELAVFVQTETGKKLMERVEAVVGKSVVVKHDLVI